MKKILVTVLAFAMVFASVLWLNAGQKEVQAADNIDMLGLKFQIATDNSNVIRFVSSVDSLDYSNVGFEVKYEGLAEPKVYTTNKVFEKVASEEAGVAYEFSPKVVDATAEYFVTAKLNATTGVDYTVRAFVTKFDGTKVYGAGLGDMDDLLEQPPLLEQY